MEIAMLQQFNPKNKDLLVNINGKLIHRNEAGVSPFDSAAQGGDAVWEGLRLYQGRIFKLLEHLGRLRSSALALAFAQIPSHEEIIEQIRRTLTANQMFDGVHIRLTLTRGAIPRVEILPIAGKGLDVLQPFPLQGERAQALLQDIQKLSAALDTDMTIEGDIGVIRPPASRVTQTPGR